jgi:hypothetical protein
MKVLGIIQGRFEVELWGFVRWDGERGLDKGGFEEEGDSEANCYAR